MQWIQWMGASFPIFYGTHNIGLRFLVVWYSAGTQIWPAKCVNCLSLFSGENFVLVFGFIKLTGIIQNNASELGMHSLLHNSVLPLDSLLQLVPQQFQLLFVQYESGFWKSCCTLLLNILFKTPEPSFGLAQNFGKKIKKEQIVKNLHL